MRYKPVVLIVDDSQGSLSEGSPWLPVYQLASLIDDYLCNNHD